MRRLFIIIIVIGLYYILVNLALIKEGIIEHSKLQNEINTNKYIEQDLDYPHK